jgi:hypothetical protein
MNRNEALDWVGIVNEQLGRESDWVLGGTKQPSKDVVASPSVKLNAIANQRTGIVLIPDKPGTKRLVVVSGGERITLTPRQALKIWPKFWKIRNLLLSRLRTIDAERQRVLFDPRKIRTIEDAEQWLQGGRKKQLYQRKGGGWTLRVCRGRCASEWPVFEGESLVDVSNKAIDAGEE